MKTGSDSGRQAHKLIMPCYLPRLKVHQPTGVQASRTHKVAEEEEEVTTGEEEAAHEDEVRPVAEVVAGAVTHDRRQTLSTKNHETRATLDVMNAKSLVIMHQSAKQRSNRTKKLTWLLMKKNQLYC